MVLQLMDAHLTLIDILIVRPDRGLELVNTPLQLAILLGLRIQQNLHLIPLVIDSYHRCLLPTQLLFGSIEGLPQHLVLL
jgi:hypothetical protein